MKRLQVAKHRGICKNAEEDRKGDGKKMLAILMAGGIGSRMGAYSDRPKCLWPVGGMPLIERTVRMLLENNCRVGIVTGYKEELLHEALKDYTVEWYHNPFFRVTNSIGSLWFAREALTGEEDVILANADVYWDQTLLDMLLRSEEQATMLGDATRTLTGDYFFKTKDGYLVNYGKDLPESERTCEYVGAAKIRSDFVNGFRYRMDRMVRNEEYKIWWENVLYEHCWEYPVYVRDVEGEFWGEIDCLEDYNRIAEHVSVLKK